MRTGGPGGGGAGGGGGPGGGGGGGILQKQNIQMDDVLRNKLQSIHTLNGNNTYLKKTNSTNAF